VPDRPFSLDGWHGGKAPGGSVVWVERKGGDGGALWRPERVAELCREAWGLVEDHFVVSAELGPSRVDLATTRPFASELHGQAFMAGMASVELVRMEATRRGSPPHSVWWTGERSKKIRARVYDKSLEAGGDPWLRVRLEDQRSLPVRERPHVSEVADPEWQRTRFVSRFAPMARAVEGVKAASFPVVAQSIADEVKYGYRTASEGRQLAGALVLMHGGAFGSVPRSTRYRWRGQLREAGYVVVPDFMEPVEVDLSVELEAALEEWA
jgi:hypothetical protein